MSSDRPISDDYAAVLADYENPRDAAAFARLWAEANKAVNRPSGMAKVRAYDLRLALVLIDRMKEVPRA